MVIFLPGLQAYEASAGKKVRNGNSGALVHAKKNGSGDAGSSLQDLYFRIVSRAEYIQTSERIDALLKKQGMSVGKIIESMTVMLKKQGIRILDVHGRIKGVYSTYLKLSKYDMDMSRIHDLIAIRIIVDDVKTCYRVLRAIHRMYIPVAGRTKDYIATPKINGYQSLHSTVKGFGTGMFEVQIRTCEMHAHAEIGSAAHWAYDLAKSSERIMGPISEQHPSPGGHDSSSG